jgi:hypothetical protein
MMPEYRTTLKFEPRAEADRSANWAAAAGRET